MVPAATGSWPTRGGPRPPPPGREPIEYVPADHVAGARGFSPRAAIAAGPRPYPISEPESVVRARLRELPMIYILILAMATFWRCAVLGDDDLTAPLPRRDRHRGPRGPHRPALEPLARSRSPGSRPWSWG